MAKTAAKEETGEQKIPRWQMRVDYVETCNCNYGCPCNFSGYPTDGFCEALVAYHIRDGRFGKVKLDNLDVVYAAAWPKAIHQGGGTLRLYFSQDASAEQRDALLRIFSGQAKGSGRATVLRLGAEGARVVVVDINDEAGVAVVAEARGREAIAAYEHCDVGEPAEVAALVERTVGRFGRLDILHNNAVQTGGGYLVELEPEVWQASLRVTLNGVFYGMRYAIPQMLRQETGGAILNTAPADGLFAVS